MPDGADASNSLADDVNVIAAHYGVSAADVTPVPQQGQVNLTVFLGQDLVLRIPRKPVHEGLLAKEAAVIPLAQSAGVPTATLVSYDASRKTVDVPYMILERVHGPTLGEFGYEPGASVRTHASLAEILAVLHELRRNDIGSIAGVSEPSEFAAERLVESLVKAGELGRIQARWLTDWFAFLETQGASIAESVLLHGDVSPSNLIVDGKGQVAAIIDWGKAGWGDPVRDFLYLPVRALPGLLSGYRSATQSRGSTSDICSEGRSLEARALWYQLFWALAKLRGKPSTSEKRHWSAPRQARFFEILRFVSTAHPSPWSELLKGPVS
ncbi:phosphotransferase family protein [Actinopolymorpha pittospori]|uniref:Aminoglycoside phosphotransferase (APT) family kinase protein n=1 Tax=Actinopolymorpha pittospori TaxID=648752 RepID=A0A927RD96_9ACTN|nr:aminoglycoside phosphotransferase family protein [Actinopolymorpha pittospori]MBE1612137.1 aminoglycoside phosphotransferase (APT) family kinase protein [Actinopolymorpha pittospori]